MIIGYLDPWGIAHAWGSVHPRAVTRFLAQLDCWISAFWMLDYRYPLESPGQVSLARSVWACRSFKSCWDVKPAMYTSLADQLNVVDRCCLAWATWNVQPS